MILVISIWTNRPTIVFLLESKRKKKNRNVKIPISISQNGNYQMNQSTEFDLYIDILLMVYMSWTKMILFVKG